MTNRTSSSLPLKVEKKSIELVKPSQRTPSETLSLSSLDNNPLDEVRHASVYVFEANEKNHKDPVSLLRKALSQLLVYYYPLSGRLVRRKSDRKFQLVCNGEGVPFTVAIAAPDLPSLNYIENFVDEVALRLVPEIDLNYESEIGDYPLAMQVSFRLLDINIGFGWWPWTKKRINMLWSRLFNVLGGWDIQVCLINYVLLIIVKKNFKFEGDQVSLQWIHHWYSIITRGVRWVRCG